MKASRACGILWLCLAMVIGYSVVHAETTPESLTLKEAIRRGLNSSAAMQQAELSVRLMELEHKQAEVNAHATVSPLQLAEAKQAYNNARYQADLQRVQTSLAVESAYYSVLKAADTVDLRVNALDRAVQQVDIAQRRHAAGQITDVQLREAEQRLKEADLAHRQAVHNLLLARMEFSQLVGLSLDGWVLTDEVTYSPDEVEIAAALASAETHRFEMIQGRQRIENAEQAVRLADNSYTPKIELQRAQIALTQAQLALEQSHDQVRHQVWEAVLRLDEAELRYELAQDRRDLAADSLTLAELRYQNGLNTLLDVLQAESVLAEAEVEAVAATYDYNVARARYISAVGLGFERWPDLLVTNTAEGV